MTLIKHAVVAVGVGLFSSVVMAANVVETTSLTGFGSAKYPENFKHFDYVNPDAPKYGKVTFGQMGTFDNFNRYASRGQPAAATGELYDPLMLPSGDESMPTTHSSPRKSVIPMITPG
ncbi:ABC transporter periplasmic substrate-binding protein [Vibrio maritimus]|uniref:ABC transporter periplasmic substrate-binding protein n=1 Tax=Vibrio maritimus TaxID=990268 RepID=A0A090T0D8_9VIBR|nr:ABC transporter periplasmic substrate-binding protein [Vibrio maritimus]